MGTRIEKKFEELRKEGKKAFIPFIMAGDPDPDICCDLVLELQRRGASIVELGVPFSDPIADGPVNQRAVLRALSQGISLPRILDMVGKIREKSEIPIALMTYLNPVHRFGIHKFMKEAKASGVDGLIVADLPPEDARDLIEAGADEGVNTIFLLAPTSSDSRIKKVCEASTGFIYYTSITGVTGIRERLSEDLKPMISKIKGYTDKPISVGFGISTPDQAREVASIADGVIVGSAIVRVIEERIGKGDIVSAVGDFAESISRAIREGIG
jgi:tryptophan synthase alpha chain